MLPWRLLTRRTRLNCMDTRPGDQPVGGLTRNKLWAKLTSFFGQKKMSTLANGQEPITYPPSKDTLERLFESGVDKPTIAQMCGVHRRSIDRLIVRYDLRKWKPTPISETERDARAASRARIEAEGGIPAAADQPGRTLSGLLISPDRLVEPKPVPEPDPDPEPAEPDPDPSSIPEPDPDEPLPVPPDLDPGIVAENRRKAKKALADAKYRQNRKARQAAAAEQNDEAWQAAQAAIVKAAETIDLSGRETACEYDALPFGRNDPVTAAQTLEHPAGPVYGPPTLAEHRRAYLRYILNRTEPCELPTGIPEPAPDTKPPGWLVTEWEYSKMFNGTRFSELPLGREKPWKV